jgi:hypothetical protein
MFIRGPSVIHPPDLTPPSARFQRITRESEFISDAFQDPETFSFIFQQPFCSGWVPVYQIKLSTNKVNLQYSKGLFNQALCS